MLALSYVLVKVGPSPMFAALLAGLRARRSGATPQLVRLFQPLRCESDVRLMLAGCFNTNARVKGLVGTQACALQTRAHAVRGTRVR
jgi:hypothetical protein